jgi:hypothetical protein
MTGLLAVSADRSADRGAGAPVQDSDGELRSKQALERLLINQAGPRTQPRGSSPRRRSSKRPAGTRASRGGARLSGARGARRQGQILHKRGVALARAGREGEARAKLYEALERYG